MTSVSVRGVSTIDERAIWYQCHTSDQYHAMTLWSLSTVDDNGLNLWSLPCNEKYKILNHPFKIYERQGKIENFLNVHKKQSSTSTSYVFYLVVWHN